MQIKGKFLHIAVGKQFSNSCGSQYGLRINLPRNSAITHLGIFMNRSKVNIPHRHLSTHADKHFSKQVLESVLVLITYERNKKIQKIYIHKYCSAIINRIISIETKWYNWFAGYICVRTHRNNCTSSYITLRELKPSIVLSRSNRVFDPMYGFWLFYLDNSILA